MKKQEIEMAIEKLKSADTNHTQAQYNLDDETIIMAISALEQQLADRWIPVTDRYPTMEECRKNDCRFIVTDGNRVYEDSYDYLADGYTEPKWTYSTMCQPIAWKSLPQLYKEVSDGN